MGRKIALVRGWVWAALAAALLSACGARAQTSAQLLLPSAMAYDSAGNVYFADTNRNQVLEATLGGQLVVVAGSGVQGFGGDGGPAASAELNSPQGVAVGADGTLYIADTGNQRVRAVTTGTISTFAGNGVRGFAGDGGLPTAAEFAVPVAITLDASGALLICDSANHRVRRIAGGVVTTIAGNGVQGFAGDGGTAAAAELDSPMGVAVAGDGRIFIADSRNHRVRVVSAAGVIATFAGTGVAGFAGDGGVATSAELALPRGLVLMPNGALLIADENNQRVRMVNTAGVISTVQGTGVQGSSTGDGVSALAAMLNSPRAVGVSKFTQPAVTDSANKLLRVEAANAALYAPAGLAAGEDIERDGERTGDCCVWAVERECDGERVCGSGAGYCDVAGWGCGCCLRKFEWWWRDDSAGGSRRRSPQPERGVWRRWVEPSGDECVGERDGDAG